MRVFHCQNYAFLKDTVNPVSAIFGLNPEKWMRILAQAVLARRADLLEGNCNKYIILANNP